MERGVVRSNYMRKILFGALVLTMIAGGCQVPQNISEENGTGFEIPVSHSESEEQKGSDPVCTASLRSSLYERPRLLPNAYPHLEALGPLFTASECGEDRLRALLDQSEDELTLDAVVILIGRNNSADLRKALTDAGFICGNDLMTDGCYTRQAGTRVSDLLNLKLVAGELMADYFENTITSFDEVSLKYPIDPTSDLCTRPAHEREGIGGIQYPVADQYSVYDDFLGEFMTQYQCSEERYAEAFGENKLYDLGIALGLKQAPSDELLRVLYGIGFICAGDEAIDDTGCTYWELRGSVPAERLIHLEPFTEEVSGSDCIHCG